MSGADIDISDIYNLSKRRAGALAKTDAMPLALRECVHEYGYAIVNACINNGVTDPKRIHILVKEIWAGARQPAQERLVHAQGASPILKQIDWLLLQSEAKISAKTLVRTLYENNLVLVPLEPNPAAIAASMETVSGFNVRVTKATKHRMRLRAAVRASTRSMWGFLFDGMTK